MIKKNLLSILDLTIDDIEKIFSLATHYLEDKTYVTHNLKNKVIVNFFLENSTRTLLSFEIAEKSLGSHAITLPIHSSSMTKGETLNDTLLTLNAMDPDFLVIRTKDSFILNTISKKIACSIINAGDGMNEHPTQSLINCFTILYLKNKIKDLNIIICGDIKHSRVARSDIKIFHKFGANIILVAPPTLMYNNIEKINSVSYSYSFDSVINKADVIIVLRIQKERIKNTLFIPSEREYADLYCLDEKKLLNAKKDILILHPGPINRNIEIKSEIADYKSSILFQVKVGVAIRKAIFTYLSQYQS